MSVIPKPTLIMCREIYRTGVPRKLWNVVFRFFSRKQRSCHWETGSLVFLLGLHRAAVDAGGVVAALGDDFCHAQGVESGDAWW